MVIEDLRRSKAKIVFVALGMPKQELWIYDHKRSLPAGIYIGLGGTFDVWAGHVKRAPLVWRKFGLEWLYRAAQEPKRWHRIVKLPLFMVLILKEKLQRRAVCAH